MKSKGRQTIQIAILSERFKSNGNYDDGPEDRYAFSLTNGVEQTFTALHQHYQDIIPYRKFDILIHYTPQRTHSERQSPDPLNAAQYALITLNWDADAMHYQQQNGVHPWTSLSRQAFETLLGLNADLIPLT